MKRTQREKSMGLNKDNRCIEEPQPKAGRGKTGAAHRMDCGLGMIIAGGGTGGHLFPGIAIAEEFLRRNPSHRVLFIGTERGLEKKILGGLGLPLRTIRVEGIKGAGADAIRGSLREDPRKSCRLLPDPPRISSRYRRRCGRLRLGTGSPRRPIHGADNGHCRAKRISGSDQPDPRPFCRSDLYRLFSLPEVVPEKKDLS